MPDPSRTALKLKKYTQHPWEARLPWGLTEKPWYVLLRAHSTPSPYLRQSAISHGARQDPDPFPSILRFPDVIHRRGHVEVSLSPHAPRLGGAQVSRRVRTSAT